MHKLKRAFYVLLKCHLTNWNTYTHELRFSTMSI